MKRSSHPSLSMSVQTAVWDAIDSASPADSVTSVNVPSQLLRKREGRIGDCHPPRRTKMSMQPSPLKSSTMTPPAIEKEFRPAAGATSTNLPISSFDSNFDGGIKYFA